MKKTSEKRLIDANALIEEINQQRRASRTSFPRRSYVVGDVLTSIYNAPTVDAVEVVHSQWDTVYYERNGTLATYSHICPVCKYFYRDTRFNGHKYCPNCGAKMDGGGNNEEH